MRLLVFDEKCRCSKGFLIPVNTGLPQPCDCLSEAEFDKVKGKLELCVQSSSPWRVLEYQTKALEDQLRTMRNQLRKIVRLLRFRRGVVDADFDKASTDSLARTEIHELEQTPGFAEILTSLNRCYKNATTEDLTRYKRTLDDLWEKWTITRGSKDPKALWDHLLDNS